MFWCFGSSVISSYSSGFIWCSWNAVCAALCYHVSTSADLRGGRVVQLFTHWSVAVESRHCIIHSTVLQHVLKPSNVPPSPLWLAHQQHLHNSSLIFARLNMKRWIIYFGDPYVLCCVWVPAAFVTESHSRHPECCVIWNVRVDWVGITSRHELNSQGMWCGDWRYYDLLKMLWC